MKRQMTDADAERDRVWCHALCRTLDPREMATVLAAFAELRPDQGRADDNREWRKKWVKAGESVAAQALGVPLAPEPAKEEWPEWWGAPLAADEEIWNDEVVERALVAAYEAARKAGVLPGLEAGPVVRMGIDLGEPVVPLADHLRVCEHLEAAAKPCADDAALARRARAALALAKARGLGGRHLGHPVCPCSGCELARILRGEQPAGGGEG